MKVKYLFVILIALIFTSCDYYLHMEGKVVDAVTLQPIKNAQVYFVKKTDSTLTDDNGYFEVSEIGGIRKSNPKVLIKADGYKPFEMEVFIKNSSIIYSVKSETEWVEYDETLSPNPSDKDNFILGTWIEKWSTDFQTKDTLIFFLERKDIKQK
ncbi:MAG TPA: carboxypeptidase-like regulatory domain-containing protein [Bacteroidales bacterium]|nr:carboxypeptidase-like regulatory domain-containing protein [Bacteroidales bacterium]